MAWTQTPDRGMALERMTRALEAAKRERERGADVHGARVLLREARAAFMQGNYAAATERADRILEALGGAAPSVPSPPPGGPAPLPAAPDATSARGWLDQALESVKEAKARGLNVHVAKAAAAEAMRAFRAGDFEATVRYANQAIQLCTAATLASP